MAPAGLVGTSAAPMATGSPSAAPVPQFPLVSGDPWAKGVLVLPQDPTEPRAGATSRVTTSHGMLWDCHPLALLALTPSGVQNATKSGSWPCSIRVTPCTPNPPGEAGASSTPLLQPHPRRGSTLPNAFCSPLPLAEHPGNRGAQEEQTGGRILLKARGESPRQRLVPPPLSPETRSSPTRQRCRRALLCQHTNTAMIARQCHAGDKHDS